jgi:hypothetical protein
MAGGLIDTPYLTWWENAGADVAASDVAGDGHPDVVVLDHVQPVVAPNGCPVMVFVCGVR